MIQISFAVIEKVPTCYCSFSDQLFVPMDRLSDPIYCKKEHEVYNDLLHHLGLQYEVTEEVLLPIFTQIMQNTGRKSRPCAVTYDLGKCLLVAQYD